MSIYQRLEQVFLKLGCSHTAEGGDQDELFIKFLLGHTTGEGSGEADMPVTTSLNTQPRTEQAGRALRTKTTILLCKRERRWTFNKNRAQCQHVITVWTKRGAWCLVVTEAEHWQMSYGSHKEIRVPEGQADLYFKQRSAQDLANIFFSFHYAGD